MRKRQEPVDLANYVMGSEIQIPEWHDTMLAISEHGQTKFYLGRVDNLPTLGSTIFHISARGNETIRNEQRFLEVSSGIVSLDVFFGGTTKYKVLDDHIVRLPFGPHRYFGAVDRNTDEENIGLTRSIFGVTFDELNQLLRAYATIVDGPPNPYWDYPRITFSKSRHNDCDLTSAFIPQNFPYIAFAESQHFNGHISLYGFYRLLATLCDLGGYTRMKKGNKFYQELTLNGASAEILDLAIDAGSGWSPSMARMA